MRTKVNFDEIEKSLDFETLTKKLDVLTENGGLKRRKTVHDLLDKMKPALLRARESKVSLEALTEFLVSSGIPVSEPTLRHYLAAGKTKKKRQSSVKKTKEMKEKTVSNPSAEAEKKPETVRPSVESTEIKKLPPRLAKRF